ncbi:MAG: hypothetical protein N0C88_17250 [Candidatus Thiodiazotropha lotti]|uniref:DUF6869 domain-containing protein n=1 Tax=Candidatus Thiodiazotropha lotti TaxID=2792787 RepID=A0A9E4N0H0_9GAMM|nr:hypothetical protein [Candidatus Thiodiazotropha lotti]MCW4205050.1 hypothetical protein [Candidatus Thiodiazotropha lotti]
MKARSPEWEALREEGQKRRAKFNQGLTSSDIREIAKSWVENLDIDKAQSASNDKVSTCIFDAAVGLKVIALIWSHGLKKENLSYLGVVVEDYLAIHGEAVIDQIEAFAERDQEFVNVLQYVYPNTMPKEVYRRVRALSGRKDA